MTPISFFSGSIFSSLAQIQVLKKNSQAFYSLIFLCHEMRASLQFAGDSIIIPRNRSNLEIYADMFEMTH